MGISYNTSNWQLGSYLADRFSVMKKVESVKLAAYFEGSSIAIGIGYDLLQHTKAEIEEDIGVALSTSQKTLLDEARSPSIGSVRLGQIADELSLAITVTQAEQAFLKVAPTYEARLNSILGGVTIPESSERIALFSMVYQGRFQNYSDLANAPRVKDNLLLALSGGNRAEAWYVVRYQSSFARNPAHANGFAKRAYYESELFSLYDNPSLVTADDAKQIYRTFQLHRAAILKYENTYSAQINAANADYGLSVVTLAAVDTLT